MRPTNSSSHTTLSEDALDQFRENCADHPDRVALVDPPDRQELVCTEPRSLTYRELERAVEATAGELLRMGLDKDDVVVAQLPNVWELAMLYLAVARAGYYRRCRSSGANRTSATSSS